ncbi:MAG: SDR family oxidoreductase [Chlamydiia bacterium]|nr:SDR family oxidoreductase [Chlamydiia bacterium]
MDLGLKGKRVLVEGASTGIGYAIAQAFVEEGAYVAIGSSDPEKIKKAASTLGIDAFFSVDLDREGAGASLVQSAAKRLGGLDVLVTNTGGPKAGYFGSLSMKDWESGFRRLWMSAIESIHAALPLMQPQRAGSILLLTSVAAKEPMDGLTLSNSYRAGLLGFMKSLSREVAPHGVTMNAVLPGYTKTERLAELGHQEEEILRQIPMKRLADPSETAALFVFLASSRARYITGQAIACDGGYLRSY